MLETRRTLTVRRRVADLRQQRRYAESIFIARHSLLGIQPPAPPSTLLPPPAFQSPRRYAHEPRPSPEQSSHQSYRRMPPLKSVLINPLEPLS